MPAFAGGNTVSQPSVTAPFEQAMSRTGLVLFRPFAISKWFVLGFCAFLAYLGEGGGGGGGYNNFGGGGGPAGPSTQPGTNPMLDWIRANFTLFIILVIVCFIVIFALMLLFAWIKSRGRFMFIDGIVRNRAAVVEPWQEFREQGNSYFLFLVAVMIAQTAFWLLLTSACIAFAWPSIQKQQFDSNAWTSMLVFIGVGVPVFLILSGFMFLVRNFMVPVMYVRRIRAMEAWRISWHELVKPNVGAVILFALMRLVIRIAIALITTIATCLTCCIAGLPYIGRVLLLPIYVFEQSYSLYFLESFGPQWRIFGSSDPAPGDVPPPFDPYDV